MKARNNILFNMQNKKIIYIYMYFMKSKNIDNKEKEMRKEKACY